MKQYQIEKIADFYKYLDRKELELIEIKVIGSQVKSMQCWELKGKIKDKMGNVSNIVILQSYYTLVAFINLKDYTLHTWKQYSPTTSRQITIWSRKYL